MQPQRGSFEQSAESPFVVRLFRPVGRLIDRFGIVGTAAIKTAIVTVGSLIICLIVYHVIELDYWAYPVAIVMPVVAPILYSIPVQLLAYHTAVIKGTDVDQPRNLAKSVTVE